MGGNHVITGTHTVGTSGIQALNYTYNGATLGVTITFSTQAVNPFIAGQLVILTGFSSLNNTDYTVYSATASSIVIGRTGTGTAIASDPGWSNFNAGSQISISPNNTSMSVQGTANISGGIIAKTFSGNGAAITSLDYNNITTNKPSTAVTSTAAAAGGGFSYSTTSGFSFTPSLTYSVGSPGTPSGSGSVSLSGGVFTYTPPVIPAQYVLPDATTSSKGGVSIGTGLAVSGGIVTNNGVVGLSAGTGMSVSGSPGGTYTVTNNGVTGITAGTGVAVSGSAGGSYTINIGQAVNTTSSVNFGSVTIGSATTATILLSCFGAIVSYDNITAYASSDIKFKENIRPIPNALEKVLYIGGKLFDWKDDYLASKGGADDYLYRKQDFGIIAQDAQKVFPEAVRTKPDGTLAVDYEKLCALAFQAIVEQEEKHKQQIESLQSQIDTIMKLLKDKE
jgi:hypothetical protein